MPPKIIDELTDLPISPGRKSWLRRQRDGLCVRCGEPAVGVSFCFRHWIEKRERERIRLGSKKRYKGAPSYRLEQMKSTGRRRFKDAEPHMSDAEIAALPISQQRKYQLRMKRDGRCTICGAPASQGLRCPKHMVQQRESKRKAVGTKKRWKHALSYRLEQGIRGATPPRVT